MTEATQATQTESQPVAPNVNALDQSLVSEKTGSDVKHLFEVKSDSQPEGETQTETPEPQSEEKVEKQETKETKDTGDGLFDFGDTDTESTPEGQLKDASGELRDVVKFEDDSYVALDGVAIPHKEVQEKYTQAVQYAEAANKFYDNFKKMIDDERIYSAAKIDAYEDYLKEEGYALTNEEWEAYNKGQITDELRDKKDNYDRFMREREVFTKHAVEREQKLVEGLKQVQQQQHQEFLNNTAAAIEAKHEVMRDAAKAKSIMSQTFSYAEQAGFTKDQLSWMSEPLFTVLSKARKYDALQGKTRAKSQAESKSAVGTNPSPQSTPQKTADTASRLRKALKEDGADPNKLLAGVL